MSNLTDEMISNFENSIDTIKISNFTNQDYQKDFMMKLKSIIQLSAVMPFNIYDTLIDLIIDHPEVQDTFKWMDKTLKEHREEMKNGNHI